MTLRQAYLLGLLGLLWGSSYLLIKIALTDFSPSLLVFIRCLLGCVVLLPLLGRSQIPWRDQTRTILKNKISGVVLVALLVIALPFMLISYGELAIPSGLAAVLVCSQPIFVPVLGIFLDHTEKVTLIQSFGLLIGLAGVTLIVGIQTVGSFAAFAGAIAVLIAGISYGLGGIFFKRVYKGYSPMLAAFWSLAVTALLLIPVICLQGMPSHAPAVSSWVAMIMLGVANTGIAFFIYFKLMREIGVGGASLVGYIQPVTGLIWGALLLGEAIGYNALAGLMLVFAGVALVTRRQKVPAT